MADMNRSVPGGEKNAMGYNRSMYDAPNQVIDVAKEPTPLACACAPGQCSCGPDCGCMCCWGNGPSGNSTIVAQNNEKGILETGLFHLLGMHTEADLGSMHDSCRQGIYATNSVGDND
jgi:hypothetical protein